MKSRLIAMAFGMFALATLAIPLAAAPGNIPWFDMENCSMCKHITAEENLMEHMEWENHLTMDGMISVTIVTPGYEEALARSMQNMKATGKKLMAGEKMYLCGFCLSHGGLQMSGANFEHIRTNAGTIELVTSHDPVVVEKIHTHGKRTIDEYNKMLADESRDKLSHEGHSHDD